MSCEEFCKAAVVYQRKQLVVIAPSVVALFVSFVFLPFHEQLQESLETRFSHATAATIAVLPVAIAFTVGIGLIIPLSFRIERRFGIACPQCKKNLAAFRHIVTAARHCPHCGERVIDPPSQ